MSSDAPSIDLRRIAAHGGSQHAAFEELCSQLARRSDDIPEHAVFQRNGAGADLGVECLWTFPDGSKWGWQAKYVLDIDSLKSQVDKSVESAAKKHPTLSRYYVCIPFTPSAARGRGRSQVEKLSAFVQHWETLAKACGSDMKVLCWVEFELRDRLLEVDPSGGRRLYWFGEPVLTSESLDAHLQEAYALAGPRYTPDLTVGHQLQPALAAVGSTKSWSEVLQNWEAQLQAAVSRWCTVLNDEDYADAPAIEVARESHPVLAHLVRLRELIGYAVGGSPDAWDDLRTETASARVKLLELVDILTRALQDEYGQRAPDSQHFRNQQAEYLSKFPAGPLDVARELSTLLGSLAEWLATPLLRAAAEGVLMISGVAGAGKTHALCDEARRRSDDGLATVLFFGSRFRDEPIWGQLCSQMGLPGSWSFSAFVDALDAIGEASGFPLLLCIDALNETSSPNLWMRELGGLIGRLKGKQFVRLCVSCRTGYLERVLSPTVDVAIVEHPGFAGAEFDACKSFFEHYGLAPPVGPLLDPEFANPLFLKLVCSAIKAAGTSGLPDGWRGFRDAMRAWVDSRDSDFARRYGPTAHGAVAIGLECVAHAMASAGTRRMQFHELRAALTSEARLLVDSTTLLNGLVEYELLIPVPGEGDSDSVARPGDSVMFAFERLGDHMIVQDALQRAGGEVLADLLAMALSEPGIAEALAVQAPEYAEQELPALVTPEQVDDVLPTWVRALPWRRAETISVMTEQWVLRALSSPRTVQDTLDSLLLLALRPGHRLDYSWLTRTLLELSMAERDKVLCRYLHEGWQAESRVRSPVARLIEAAWVENVDGLADEAVVAWVSTLCWYFSAADRRVRDEATRAAIRLSRGRPALWVHVCESLLTANDDYIVERVLLCTYGVLLANPDAPTLSRIAPVILERVFQPTTHPNASIRDLARCVCELALAHSALPNGVDLDEFRPPYSSEWPIQFPAAGFIEQFGEGDSRRNYPRLAESLDSHFHGDFAIYTVASVMEPYDEVVSHEEACRWILQSVLHLGYTPERFADYDWEMVHRFGGGREREAWAERIGKKYQRISLSRLVATTSDHVRRKPEPSYIVVEADGPLPKQLPSQRLRDMDPSISLPVDNSSVEADLVTGRPDDDGDWIDDTAEFARLEEEMWHNTCLGRSDWLPLEAHRYLVDNKQRPGDLGFRRQMWMQMRSYLVPADAFPRVWEWARTRRLTRRQMPEGYDIVDNVFIGEYPWGISLGPAGLGPALPADVGESDGGCPVPVIPTTHHLRNEFTEDCSRAARVSLIVPVPQLLTGCRWDGGGGFVGAAGETDYADPSVTLNGVPCCLARVPTIKAYLKSGEYSLFWTVLGEKLPGNYRKVRRVEYCHVRALHDGELRSAPPTIEWRPSSDYR